jgi:hypothetical protein
LVSPIKSMKEYHYTNENGQPQGPVGLEALKLLATQKTIHPETWVIETGMADWIKYSELKVAAPLAPSSPPPKLASPGVATATKIEANRTESSAAKADLGKSKKNFYIALALCAVIGVFAAHRFY